MFQRKIVHLDIPLVMCLLLMSMCAHGQIIGGSPSTRATGPTWPMPSPTFGPSPTHEELSSSVECLVIDQTGHPVRDAAVHIRRTTIQMHSASGYTDTLGLIRFTQLPYGIYQISAALGTAMTSERVDLNAAPSRVVLRLSVDSAAPLDASERATISAMQMRAPRAARKEFSKADSAFRKRDNADARVHLERALQIYPTYADALALRGILSLIEGQVDHSRADLELAISYDRSLPVAHFALATIYNDRGDYDKACRFASNGISLSPLSWQGHYEAAWANLGKGDYKSALREVQRAEELLAPRTLAGMTLVKARALAGTGDWAAAEMLLRTFLSRTEDASAADGARCLLEALLQQSEGTVAK